MEPANGAGGEESVVSVNHAKSYPEWNLMDLTNRFFPERSDALTGFRFFGDARENEWKSDVLDYPWAGCVICGWAALALGRNGPMGNGRFVMFSERQDPSASRGRRLLPERAMCLS